MMAKGHCECGWVGKTPTPTPRLAPMAMQKLNSECKSSSNRCLDTTSNCISFGSPQLSQSDSNLSIISEPCLINTPLNQVLMCVQWLAQDEGRGNVPSYVSCHCANSIRVGLQPNVPTYISTCMYMYMWDTYTSHNPHPSKPLLLPFICLHCAPFDVLESM